ncbi:MAG: AAA family ATPase [Candidatus Pacearchaeota archaeon]|nr:AAA family ATPase [Candidatus Pacearchaeota archaeon]
MGESIGILSIKGGVGKTTTTVALGSALAQRGKSVLLVDANFSAPNLALHLGIVQPEISLYDVLQGKANALGAVEETDYGFDIIAGRLNMKKVFYPDYMKLKEKIQHLKYHYDVILIDSSPTLDHETLAAMMASDKLLIVTTPDHATLSCTLHAVKVAKQKKVPIVGLIINKVYGKKFELSLEQIEKITGVPVLAVVPHEINIPKALAELRPSTFEAEETEAVVEYKKLAAFLVGESYKDKRFSTKLKAFFFSSKLPKQEINRQLKNKSYKIETEN